MASPNNHVHWEGSAGGKMASSQKQPSLKSYRRRYSYPFCSFSSCLFPQLWMTVNSETLSAWSPLYTESDHWSIRVNTFYPWQAMDLQGLRHRYSTSPRTECGTLCASRNVLPLSHGTSLPLVNTGDMGEKINNSYLHMGWDCNIMKDFWNKVQKGIREITGK